MPPAPPPGPPPFWGSFSPGQLIALALTALSSLAAAVGRQQAGDHMSRWSRTFLALSILFATCFVILFAIAIDLRGIVAGAYRALPPRAQGFSLGVSATVAVESLAFLAWKVSQRARKRREARRQEEKRQRDLEVKEHAQRLATEAAEHAKRLAAEDARSAATRRKADKDEFTKVYRQKCAPAFFLALHFFRSVVKQEIPERKAVIQVFEAYLLPPLNRAIQNLDSKLNDLTDLDAIKPALAAVVDGYLNVTREIFEIGPHLLGGEFSESRLEVLRSRMECISGLENLRHLPGMPDFIGTQLVRMQLQEPPAST